jgi:hypothetical protein
MPTPNVNSWLGWRNFTVTSGGEDREADPEHSRGVRNGGRRKGEKRGERGKKEERKSKTMRKWEGKMIKKVNIVKGNSDILHYQSNRSSRFANRFPKRLQLHQKSHSIGGVKAGVVLRGDHAKQTLRLKPRALLITLWAHEKKVISSDDKTHCGEEEDATG